jgi:hypothetical protein
VTENPASAVVVQFPNPTVFSCSQIERAGAAIRETISGANHVIAVRRKTPAVSSLFSKLSSTKPER